MKTDLFQPTKRRKLSGKLRELAAWCREARLIHTSEVHKWGTANYYISAVRAAQLLAERGYLRRLTEDEQHDLVGKHLGQGTWVVTEQLLKEDLS